MAGELKIHTDVVAEKLDEMADLCEYWKRHRSKNCNPNAIRSALLMIAKETIFAADMEERRIAEEIEKLHPKANCESS